MRERRTAIFPIALSPAKLAECLGIRDTVVADAIKNDLLPVYRQGVKRRVLVADAIEWVRTTWERVR
jgi:hypothetical protein